MADYFPLITRAVANLEKNTGEARCAHYEHARKALVGRLSMTSTSFRLSGGPRHCSTYARKVLPDITPSMTHGAVIPLRRRPATKVILPMSARGMADQPLVAWAAAAQPHHFRIGSSHR